MPVHKIQGGYQYGTSGKKYYGKDAKKKAERQALAIRLSGYKEPNHKPKKPKLDYRAIGKAFVMKLLRKEP